MAISFIENFCSALKFTNFPNNLFKSFQIIQSKAPKSIWLSQKLNYYLIILYALQLHSSKSVLYKQISHSHITSNLFHFIYPFMSQSLFESDCKSRTERKVLMMALHNNKILSTFTLMTAKDFSFYYIDATLDVMLWQKSFFN